jgi:hypothetical protein
MPPSGADKIRQQSTEELERIAQVSMTIRQAIRDALPAPPEQFFTMMIPAKVLNLDVSPAFFRHVVLDSDAHVGSTIP